MGHFLQLGRLTQGLKPQVQLFVQGKKLDQGVFLGKLSLSMSNLVFRTKALEKDFVKALGRNSIRHQHHNSGWRSWWLEADL